MEWEMPEAALALIYTTFSSSEDAEGVARALVGAKLAACVNILPAMTAIYAWQGEVQRDSECAVLIKTRQELVDAVEAELTRLHTYEVPAFLVIPVTRASEAYGAWLSSQTRATAAPGGAC